MHLSVSIANHDPLQIVASADVAEGWKRDDRGYGFYAKGGIPYVNDRGLEFTVNVRVRPYGEFAHFASFPESLQKRGSWGVDVATGAYDVKEGNALVLVDVDSLRNVLEQKGGDPFHFKPVILAQGPGRLLIQMNVSVRVVATPPAPKGDVREHDTQFCQGGLPSLGKRRP